jgi:hypothetical protein
MGRGPQPPNIPILILVACHSAATAGSEEGAKNFTAVVKGASIFNRG